MKKMEADRRSAAMAGCFLIAGSVIGLAGMGAALGPLEGAGNPLAAWGAMQTRATVACLLELLMSASLVAMAASIYPLLSRRSPAAAVAYFGARLLEAVPIILGVLSRLALVDLGKAYLAAGPAEAARFEVLGAMLAELPDLAGHAILDVGIFPLGAALLNYLLLRARLVPRALSAWGLIGAVLYWAAGLLVMFRLIVPLALPHILLQAPLGLQEMALAAWLIARGVAPGAASALSLGEVGEA